MGSALRNTHTPDDPPSHELAAPSHASASAPHDALRLQVAERLAAHRNRRSQMHPQPPALPSTAPTGSNTRSARIAQTVAERYAHSLSYRAFLAAEAERATRQAQAAAEIAARNAEAVAQAEQQLLHVLYPEISQEQAPEDELSEQLHPEPEQLTLASDPGGPSFPAPSERMGYRAAARPSSSPSHARSTPTKPRQPLTSAATPAPGLTVRLFADTASANPLLPPAVNARYGSRRPSQADEAEARALDEEISFRQAPVFEEPAGPPMPLPANLLQFPRQLVAPRKVRPRYAEGPLREEDALEPDGSQLRIFEVEATQISTTPELAGTQTPQWTSLWLDTPNSAPASASNPAEAPSVSEEYAAALAAADPLLAPYATAAPHRYPAALSRRLLAATIDACLIGAGFLASAATVAAIELHASAAQPGRLHQFLTQSAAALTGHAELQPIVVLASAAAALVFLYLLYQFLFFSLSEATPGMRYARIALCTFGDDNPTRRAMRRRILAVLLSASPLGLGLLWATLDENRLTWHDLISRMYQRSY